MPDSNSPPSDNGFLKQCKTQLGSVGKRVLSDTKNIVFSEKGDLNVLATAGMIGVGLVVAPWAFTAIGILSVGAAALKTPVKEQADVRVDDAVPAGA